MECCDLGNKKYNYKDFLVKKVFEFGSVRLIDFTSLIVCRDLLCKNDKVG